MSTLPSSPTPVMWLAHHDAEHVDRCASIGGHLVCRRCLVLYPGMFAVAALQLAGAIPSTVGIVLMWAMPLPVVGEWISEHLAGVAYSARRQVATTALASVSFGVAFGRHLRHPFEAAATAPAIVFTALCLVVWFVGARRHDPNRVDWEADFETAEEERLDALLAVLGEVGVGEVDLSDRREDQPAS